MRSRINRAAICSSSNYALSKRLHREYLKEAHASFTGFSFSTSSEEPAWHPATKTIMVFGKPMVITYSEYEERNLKELGF